MAECLFNLPGTGKVSFAVNKIVMGSLLIFGCLIGCSEPVGPKEAVEISTRLGAIEGFRQYGVLHFFGIPYAEPPVGEKRFMPPVAAKPWSGVLSARTHGNRCLQGEDGLEGEGTPFREDCLYLNIYTPSVNGEKRPVLFWIHGGGFTQGSANGYDGSVLAEQGDVVVVSINYRLGFLGFADLSDLGDAFIGSASNGIRDQIMALNWVAQNIQDFGGDPENITIFGESAGGTSVLGLMAAPSADGLFHKAIAHSPVLINLQSRSTVPSLISKYGLEGEALLEHMYSLTEEDILEAQTDLEVSGGRIDGTVITRSTVEAIVEKGTQGVPLIAGTNRDEGTLFSVLIPDEMWVEIEEGVAASVVGGDPTEYLAALKTQYTGSQTKYRERVWGDMFRIAAIASTQKATKAGPGGWLYRFDLVSSVPFLGEKFGATHGAEMPFTFNSYARSDSGFPGRSFMGFEVYDSDEQSVSRLANSWSATVVQFARHGDPNGAGLPEWPRYQADKRKTMVLDEITRIEEDWEKDELLFWRSVDVFP